MTVAQIFLVFNDLDRFEEYSSGILLNIPQSHNLSDVLIMIIQGLCVCVCVSVCLSVCLSVFWEGGE